MRRKRFRITNPLWRKSTRDLSTIKGPVLQSMDNPQHNKYRLFKQKARTCKPKPWRYNGRRGVSNHQLFDCLLNRLFRRRSKKTSKLRVIGLCEGNSPVTGEFPAQSPVTRKMFPFDDVTMIRKYSTKSWCLRMLLIFQHWLMLIVYTIILSDITARY